MHGRRLTKFGGAIEESVERDSAGTAPLFSTASAVREKTVWIYRQGKADFHNTDAQSLLHNMGVQAVVLRFLRLPFTQKEILGDELNVRFF